LAQNVVRQHGDDVAAVVGDLFRITTSRRASDDELRLLVELHGKQRERFTANAEQATEWLSVGDKPRDETLDPPLVAATASVANMLLNYDGCVTKR